MEHVLIDCGIVLALDPSKLWVVAVSYCNLHADHFGLTKIKKYAISLFLLSWHQCSDRYFGLRNCILKENMAGIVDCHACSAHLPLILVGYQFL